MPTSLPASSSASATDPAPVPAPDTSAYPIASPFVSPFVPPIPRVLSILSDAELAARLAQADARVGGADWTGALACYLRTIEHAPLAFQSYLGLTRVFEALGRGHDALACRAAALALEAGTALDLYNLGTAYLMTGHLPQAEAWYRLALLRDPALVVAHRNLAAVLRDLGRTAEAQTHLDAAYRRQHCFDNQRAAPAVLLICAAGRGNVPLDVWFPPASMRRIEYMVEYAPEDDDARLAEMLPPAAVLFNAIGDADVLRPSLARVERLCERFGRRVMNAPLAVARTARDALAVTLSGLDDVIVPPAWRLEHAEVEQAVRAAHAREPASSWLLRPVATHGGEGLRRIDPAQAAAFRLDSDPSTESVKSDQWYLTRFVETRCDDGFYRKYRMVLIDGVPYPYHLAIASHWLVHYFSADMLADAGKQAEEGEFLARPGTVLGGRAMAALAAIGARLELQYAGVDFTLLPDGRVLVFEANATMLVHREVPRSPLAYKNPHIERMCEAFLAMRERYTG